VRSPVTPNITSAIGLESFIVIIVFSIDENELPFSGVVSFIIILSSINQYLHYIKIWIKQNAITDVPGILVGQAEDQTALTGCSVVICKDGAMEGSAARRCPRYARN
jgi:hypothetical protein